MTRLTLKAPPPVRLAMEGLLPERLAGLGAAEIERLPLALGNRKEPLGDWFRLEPGEPESLVIAGAGERLDRIGAGMTRGRIIVEGDAGAYLGLGLVGGEIEVAGAAGYGAATDMRDGLIRIAGDAGEEVGAALPGAEGGMRGGTVIIGGKAAARCGYQLRRGLIVVKGDAGAACGGRMSAGTILLGGQAEAYAGAAMRHGSILALGGFARPGPGFLDGGVQELVVMRLFARMLTGLGLAALAKRLGPMQRLLGDQAVGGKGELLASA
jgi:formylmethanofuran dehydrogenase subunit C